MTRKWSEGVGSKVKELIYPRTRRKRDVMFVFEIQF